MDNVIILIIINNRKHKCEEETDKKKKRRTENYLLYELIIHLLTHDPVTIWIICTCAR